MSGIEIITPGVELISEEHDFSSISRVIELAARNCYKSERSLGRDPEGFISRLVKVNGHASVIEHRVITVRYIVSRAASHQLVRHRISAFSQESQRYVDYVKRGAKVICPPSIADHKFLKEHWLHKRELEYEEYEFYRKNGIKPEDSRSVLSNSAKTEVVTTFNLRVWRHIFEARALNGRAQWEIRGTNQLLLEEFGKKLPYLFSDLSDQLEEKSATTKNFDARKNCKWYYDTGGDCGTTG